METDIMIVKGVENVLATSKARMTSVLERLFTGLHYEKTLKCDGRKGQSVMCASWVYGETSG